MNIKEIQIVSDESTFPSLFDMNYAGSGIFLIILLFIIGNSAIIKYKDKHDECKIFQNNLEAQLTLDIILSVNPKEMSAYISYLSSDSNKYLRLNKVFIDNVHVGDSIDKFEGKNFVTIYRGKQRIEVPFAQVPTKDCK